MIKNGFLLNLLVASTSSGDTISDGYSSSPCTVWSPLPTSTSSSQLMLLVLESVLSEFLRLACSVHASGYEKKIILNENLDQFFTFKNVHHARPSC